MSVKYALSLCSMGAAIIHYSRPWFVGNTTLSNRRDSSGNPTLRESWGGGGGVGGEI